MDRAQVNLSTVNRRGSSNTAEDDEELSRARMRNTDLGKQPMARASKHKSGEMDGNHQNDCRLTGRPLGYRLTKQCNVIRNPGLRVDNIDDSVDDMQENDATPGGITYLSNIQTTIKAIWALHLTVQQIEVLKKTPF